MQSFNRHSIICSIAKQVAMPSYWSAINNGSLLGFDRTPESHRVREGWDG